MCVLLCFTHFTHAAVREDHHQSGNTDKRVNDAFNDRPCPKKPFDEVPVKEPDESPVEGADDHKDPAQFAEPTLSVLHKKRLRMNT